MNKEPIFEWNKETGMAFCTLSDGKTEFLGIATCHPEDMDMMNEKTGCQIALWRAEIKYYNHIKNNEIKPALAALKQLYHSIDHSKYFNPKSYETKAILRHIQQKEDEFSFFDQMIKKKKRELKEYINNKDDFYKKIRLNRKKTQD